MMDDDGGAGGDDHHHGHQIMMQLSFSCHSCYHMLSLELYIIHYILIYYIHITTS
jgi:hypothetical protein